MKIYFVRHQAAGVVHELPFEQPPSVEQLGAIERALVAQHGARHPKTDAPYWIRVLEVEVVGPADQLGPHVAGPGGVGAGELATLRGEGAGEIR